jgi:6-phosphogluconolactonase (cycloisomerase 2 family)
MMRVLAYVMAVCPAIALTTSLHAATAVGAVYVMSNSPAGNEVLAFDRLADGTLAWQNSYPTGGTGTGAGLGNQGAVTLSRDHRWLFVVNAGSDDLSVFGVESRGLRWVQRIGANGEQPVSVTAHGRLVYVLSAASDSIAGFAQRPDGTLEPIPGSLRPLSGVGTAPAQIQFSPDGRLLVVTEKATSQLTVFEVDKHGRAGAASVYPSQGETPFGFAFGKRGQLFVSEAFGGAPDVSAVSSYVLADGPGGGLAVVTPSAPTHETAACWVATDAAGRYVYTTNTADNSVSGFAVDADGALTLLDADGKTGTTGAGPIDLAFSGDGRFLYVLSSGDGSLSAFRVRGDGALEAIAGADGLPDGANGLAAR